MLGRLLLLPTKEHDSSPGGSPLPERVPIGRSRTTRTPGYCRLHLWCSPGWSCRSGDTSSLSSTVGCSSNHARNRPQMYTLGHWAQSWRPTYGSLVRGRRVARKRCGLTACLRDGVASSLGYEAARAYLNGKDVSPLRRRQGDWRPRSMWIQFRSPRCRRFCSSAPSYRTQVGNTAPACSRTPARGCRPRRRSSFRPFLSGTSSPRRPLRTSRSYRSPSGRQGCRSDQRREGHCRPAAPTRPSCRARACRCWRRPDSKGGSTRSENAPDTRRDRHRRSPGPKCSGCSNPMRSKGLRPEPRQFVAGPLPQSLLVVAKAERRAQGSVAEQHRKTQRWIVVTAALLTRVGLRQVDAAVTR